MKSGFSPREEGLQVSTSISAFVHPCSILVALQLRASVIHSGSVAGDARPTLLMCEMRIMSRVPARHPEVHCGQSTAYPQSAVDDMAAVLAAERCMDDVRRPLGLHSAKRSPNEAAIASSSSGKMAVAIERHSDRAVAKSALDRLWVRAVEMANATLVCRRSWNRQFTPNGRVPA